STFGDIVGALAPLFPRAEVPPAAREAGAGDDPVAATFDDNAVAVLRAARDQLEPITDWTPAQLDAAIKRVGAATGARGRTLYEPLRRALTGRPHGPPLTAVLRVQGRSRVLGGLASALERAGSPAGARRGANPAGGAAH